METHRAGFFGNPVFYRKGSAVPCAGRKGFSLLEMLVVVALAVATATMAFQIYASYTLRTTAQRSARIFAWDLSRARANAVQTRSTVVIRFDESAMDYEVENAQGRLLARRDYGDDGDFPLSNMDLELSGDSLVVNGRGIVDISELGGSLGTALFQAGGNSFTVSFNSLGTSRIDEI